MIFEKGDKVKLKNGSIVTINEQIKSLGTVEGYSTYENILVTTSMIQEKVN